MGAGFGDREVGLEIQQHLDVRRGADRDRGCCQGPISSWGRWHDPGRKEGSVRQRETKGKNIKIKEREAKILGPMADTSLAERSGPRDRVNLRLQVQGRQASSCSS